MNNNNNTMNNNNINNNLKLELNSILIGIMLSDGGLYRSSPTANLRFENEFLKYKSLAFHIGELFKDYISNPVKPIEIKGKNKVYINYRLKTKTLPVFNSYYEMFYNEHHLTNKYVKIVIIDPINNRDQILKISKGEKGIYI